ncbi:hypothetical protein [Nonomuraea polychroma]|uniref:HNH endonuclease n=1 Tax=Nonomuraea polychroma TaxID=46176 RepID=UPI000FDF0AA7
MGLPRPQPHGDRTAGAPPHPGRSQHGPDHQPVQLTGRASSATPWPGPDQPAWAALMIKKRRKTLVVCRACHEAIHHGQPAANAA